MPNDEMAIMIDIMNKYGSFVEEPSGQATIWKLVNTNGATVQGIITYNGVSISVIEELHAALYRWMWSAIIDHDNGIW